ncbi:hypothetical protein EDC96DRAFT_172759 [Choanephora cucurbitarum]|nr:hypothetical protein EDC96DRAFT_172759 [Choanephora cucurbitarum]
MSCSLKTQSVTDAIKNELTCALCQDVYDKPQALIPCLHSFCLNCVLYIPKNSRDDSLVCPVCRSKANTYCKNFTLQNLIDIISDLGEESSSEPKTPTPATVVSKPSSSSRSSSTNIRVTSQPQTINISFTSVDDNSKRPCRSCIPGNDTGYRCPIPITDEQQDGFGHILCGYCSEYMPARGFGGNEPALNQCCSFCGVVSCSEYWNCSNSSNAAKLYILNESISDWANAVDIIESKEDGHLNRCEIALLTLYLEESEISWDEAWKVCLNDLDNGYFTAPILRRMTSLGMEIYNTRRLPDYSLQTGNQASESSDDDDDYYDRIEDEGTLPSHCLRACYTCTATIVNGQFYSYWRDAIRTGDVCPQREKCPQGILCQAQWRTQTHAQRLSHVDIDTP